MITGAASGLGRQLAVDMAGKGMRFVLADLNPEGLQETAEMVRKAGSQAVCRVTNVTDEGECVALMAYAAEQFPELDCLVLCAGISMWALFEEITDLSLFRRLIEVNFLGAVYCVHAALPRLRASRGTVVAISSLQGELGVAHHTGYAAAKHALNGFIEALEFELGDEVHFLTIMPGWISGTNLRSSAFHSDGSVLGESAKKHSGNSVTVQEASRRILRALARDSRTLFIPGKLRYLAALKLILPGYVHWLVNRALAKQEAANSSS